LAVKILKQKGYRIIERNWQSTLKGELDVVAIKDNCLIFVEVKTRHGEEFGEPQEAIGPHKIRSLKRAAWHYYLSHTNLPERMRIDALAITILPGNEQAKVMLFEDIS